MKTLQECDKSSWREKMVNSAATTNASPGRPSNGNGRDSNVSPTQLKIAAALLIGGILAGVLALTVFSDPGTPTKPNSKPSIIPTPNQGTAPKSGGDRGGWEQLALLGAIIVVVSGITYFGIRGGGATKRPGRAAWEAAGASDHDGAVS